MNGFDLSTISGLYVGSTPYSAIYKGSIKIWEAAPPDYSLEYFTIESLEDNNVISINGVLGYGEPAQEDTVAVWYYSTNKVNWTEFDVKNSTQYYNPNFITLNKNQKVYLKTTSQFYKTGIINAGGSSTYQYNYFGTTKNFKVYGNIMSLCYGDNFVNQTTLSWTYTFYYLFRSCTKLVDISNLILPATTLTNYCYSRMFYGCSSLTTAPELPSTTLASYCYSRMFYGCSSLTTAPELLATTLASYCYEYMFYGCSSLTTPPEPPATTLASYCYQYMFQNCTSLTTAPVLSAEVLAPYCYRSMFQNCTSLTTAPELSATTLTDSCYLYMFYGCTSLTTAPELPATTLATQCYMYMFYCCSSLTTAPVLKATTLVSLCYYQMFYGCTSLNYVKALFTTDISTATSYTYNWLYNVAAIGTFIKGQGASWSRTDASGIPSGWTVKVDGAPEDYATIKLYCNYNRGTTYNTHVISTGSSTTANNYLSDPLKANRKDTTITNNQVNYSGTQAFDYVIYGFSQFYLELYCTQTSSDIKYVSLHPLNGGTTLYGWGNQNQGLIYASNNNSYGHYYSFDNLDPTKKYHIRIEVMMSGTASSKRAAYVYMPYIYPTQTIENGYFTSSQDWSSIYSS